MTRLLLKLLVPAFIVTAILFLTLVLTAQQDPARPFPNHEEPPAGWNCSRQNLNGTVDEAHACGCRRMCQKDGDGNEIVAEDPACKVFCHKDHCTCEVTKCETH